MKAAIYTKYGSPDVVRVEEIPKPKPKENEVLIKIHYSGVTAGDARLRASDFPPLFWLPARLIFGLFAPKKQVLGHEFSGIIEEVGSKVTEFNQGDEVFGTTTMLKQGSHAEYVCIPEKWKSGVLIQKPKNLTHKEAAALPIGGMTAAFLFEKGGISQNQNVLIYGASGSVGSFAVQIAKYHGANVTAVCGPDNLEMVKSLGAHKAIDYRVQDYSLLNEEFDIVFDAVGKTSKKKAKKVLKEEGSFVTVESMTKERMKDLKLVSQMAQEGRLTAFIDQTFSLDEIVKAYEIIDSGRKKGNILIKVL